ncbi:calcium-binding and coiled-coil domain-containing protein 2 isoform X1 [Scomber scombrus]|uniref:calcium-binding and coiled-coil domain-containing protein 2 isoform X1 n=1 Tax=Scomber scombrus TaxID=13677 RepID=UPI002DD7AAC2|nr:calcium-binding and coiled-coil domain-containing protein 2 isoform X1 [Scomber scombrus]
MASLTDTSAAEAAALAAAANSLARTFSQVVFTDIPHSYPPATPITCSYTITEAFQPNSRDWVGIFKVGWSTTKDYHTFVWVELDTVGQQAVRQADFKDYYLPKDEIEFYQFCYVDSGGQVRGASTPFSFKSPVEQNLESNMDDDLLVITTQEQVDQGVREKAELMKEMDQIREEKDSLKKALQEVKSSFEEQNGQKEKEKCDLVDELDQTKEQNEKLRSSVQEKEQEIDRLKEEMMLQKSKQMEIQQQNAAEIQKLSQSVRLDGAARQNETHAQEKYDRAVMKINQMKEEREELRGKNEAQSDEIAKLSSKLREAERELFKMKDSVQLLQVDLQSSEKEKERLAAELHQLQSVTHNMDEVKKENKQLNLRLSQQETQQQQQQQSSPDEDLKALRKQLQEVQTKLSAEKDESKNSKRRADFLEGELQQVREQLDSVAATLDGMQRRSSKQEMRLLEAHEMLADKEGIIEEKEHNILLVRKEVEDLVKENETLKGDIDELRRVYADYQAAPGSSSEDQPTYVQPDDVQPASSSTQDASEQSENLYETIGGEEPEEEQALVCRHCQERFPGITQHELEQHEQSHRVCPFCTMICDNMEQSVFEDHVYSHEL